LGVQEKFSSALNKIKQFFWLTRGRRRLEMLHDHVGLEGFPALKLTAEDRHGWRFSNM